jgi:hypothetical protein
MTKEDLELVKKWQAWRRDNTGDLPMQDPIVVGKSIDKMIAYFEEKFNKNKPDENVKKTN